VKKSQSEHTKKGRGPRKMDVGGASEVFTDRDRSVGGVVTMRAYLNKRRTVSRKNQKADDDQNPITSMSSGGGRGEASDKGNFGKGKEGGEPILSGGY